MPTNHILMLIDEEGSYFPENSDLTPEQVASGDYELCADCTRFAAPDPLPEGDIVLYYHPKETSLGQVVPSEKGHPK